jgi:chemotaxis protein MotA
MSDLAQAQTSASQDFTPDPPVEIEDVAHELDPATLIGLLASLGLIAAASLMGNENANFFNLPSVFIVILGTAAVTSVSYTGDELAKAWSTIRAAMIRPVFAPQALAVQLMNIAVIARKRGILHLANYDEELKKDPFLAHSMTLVGDGFQATDIESVLQQDIETTLDRYKKSASILRRASEIAPGMGLIGTLVGLVQMLSQLDNPASIGPAMAVALLTTFYGAVMGTVVLAPVAAKIEHNAGEEALVKTMIMATASSIARQENPRRLEISLNSLLPSAFRITYFK